MMIVKRSDKTRESMMAKEDQENVRCTLATLALTSSDIQAAYLFRAALSELSTELNVKARNDGTNLRTMAGAIRREVDTLEQKMKEDIQTLKHE